MPQAGNFVIEAIDQFGQPFGRSLRLLTLPLEVFYKICTMNSGKFGIEVRHLLIGSSQISIQFPCQILTTHQSLLQGPLCRAFVFFSLAPFFFQAVNH